MSIANLRFEQFSALLHSVFGLHDHERALTLFVDWFTQALIHSSRLPFSAIQLCAYTNVGSNNGALPDIVQRMPAAASCVKREQ